ncbi:fibropellin-3-like, partial [Limulus polyphemus]|uniref:Fibropellin-3-like n=1 Tax=Limulus polyphemus TaxID=6850 RepID=A0ABM1TL94_LIMPO
MFRCGLCFCMILLLLSTSLGETSSTSYDYCASDPCKNGGTCEENENDFYCECPPHFVGKTCATKIDVCKNNPCFNGGTCEIVEDGPHPFICVCTEEYSGRFCNLTIKNCLSNPCKNGGTCEEEEDGFYCHCPSHFGGKTCSLSFEICASHPCLNGGTCILVEDGPREYMCKCNEKYGGENCQIKKPPMVSDRFHTVGELVFPLVPDREISEAEIVCAIEESYDPHVGMSVFHITIAGEQDTIVENLFLNQTFMHNSSG